MKIEMRCRDCGHVCDADYETPVTDVGQSHARCPKCGGVMDPTPEGLVVLDRHRHATRGVAKM